MATKLKSRSSGLVGRFSDGPVHGHRLLQVISLTCHFTRPIPGTIACSDSAHSHCHDLNPNVCRHTEVDARLSHEAAKRSCCHKICECHEAAITQLPSLSSLHAVPSLDSSLGRGTLMLCELSRGAADLCSLVCGCRSYFATARVDLTGSFASGRLPWLG